MKPVEIVIVGAGDRGNTYAEYAKAHPNEVRVVGVAEPRKYYREKMARDFDIAMSRVFTNWSDATKISKFADAVIIATPDSQHVDPAVAFADEGYHILLEKPMAPTEEGCRRITDAAIKNGILLSVCHVLRYTRYTQKLKDLLNFGAIGDIISLQRLEPVGYWHQAHSFVRGNWRRDDESTFMLLAKSCHDIDWIRYIMGENCTKVSSFGSLTHFKTENKPPKAGSNCLECNQENDCCYSAKKIYLGFLNRGVVGWPVSVVTPDVTEKGLLEALKSGPYGRCVYECDNNVVDHQVVNMEFEKGLTASFTMTAFTKARQRETRIFGTKGEIYGDGTTIRVYDFLSEETEVHDTSAETSILTDHGGGDYWLMHQFIEAVSNGDPSKILSGPIETLETHLMTFAAERSRRENRIIPMSEYI